MKKKMMTVLSMVGVFALLSVTSKLLATEAGSVAEQFGIKTEWDGTVTMQGTPKANGTNDGSNDAIYATSVKLTKEFENNRKIVAKFKIGRGSGLDQSLQAYAQVNSDSDDTINPQTNDAFAKIAELSYQQSFLDTKLTANIGKLSFGSYFADNKYADDFVTDNFSGDKIINNTPGRLALRLHYMALDKLDISYACFTNTNLDCFDIKGVNILQVTYKPSQKDSYKVYAWLDNKEDYLSFENIYEKSGNYGVGISLDKEMTEKIGMFGKFAYKDTSVGSLSIGAQAKGSLWSRANDVVGFAIGQIYCPSDYKKYENKTTIKIGTRDHQGGVETQIELYYKFVVTKHIALIPTVQYLVNPKGGNVATDGDIFVYGIRTQFTF